MCVCHKCDTPQCVNPDHLFLGTQLENMRDKVKKGRSNLPRGSDSASSILTDQQVVKIRTEYRPGKNGYTKLAKQYEVGQATIRDIIKRVTWIHL